MSKIPRKNKNIKHKAHKRIKKRKHSLKAKVQKRDICTINRLPMEILLKIFAHLPHKDLFNNVQKVSSQFHSVANHASLWMELKAGPEIPTELLLKWLERASKLRSLELNSRVDATLLMKKIVKENRGIEVLKIHDCWGSPQQVNLPASVMCRLLTRCPYLNCISLYGCRLQSCKFFRLLATLDVARQDKIPLAVRNKRLQRTSSISFSGNASVKQLRVFLAARRAANFTNLAYLSVENRYRGFEHAFLHEIIPDNEEDAERILNALQRDF